MSLVATDAQRLGVRYESGHVVDIDDAGEGVLVRTENGRTFEADLLIIAAGSWTPSLLPEMDDPEVMTPTGQAVATIQLTDEEAKQYRDMPVRSLRSTSRPI
jgi:sarcosine oxidase/L-pipecolate oxidase